MIAPRHLWVDEPRAALLGITERQADVLCGVASGMTNAQIGRALFLQPDTVKMHVGRLRRHLGATDRAHAVALAYEQGILRTPAERLRAQAAQGGWVAIRHEVAS